MKIAGYGDFLSVSLTKLLECDNIYVPIIVMNVSLKSNKFNQGKGISMNKLISFFVFAVLSCPVFAVQDSIYSSSGDGLSGLAGEWVEASYFVTGDNLNNCKVSGYCGCFENVLDSVSVVWAKGWTVDQDYNYVLSQSSANTELIFTAKGKVKFPDPNPYVVGAGAIKFYQYATFNTGEKICKTFSVTRITFADLMGNGINHGSYNGTGVYMVYDDANFAGWFISESGLRYAIPYTGNSSWNCLAYANATAASWNLDRTKEKLVPTEELQKYPISSQNVLVKPGYCALYNVTLDKYYESISFGVLKEITKAQADQYGPEKIDTIPDCFMTGYSISSATKVVPKTGMKSTRPFLMGARNPGAVNFLGQRTEVGLAAGILITHLANGATATKSNLNRWHNR
jgi:hypothetical protein